MSGLDKDRNTHWFGHLLLPDGWAASVRLHLVLGLIAAVERNVPARPDDIRHGVGLPGLPNLHSHAFQRGMAGLAEVRGAGRDSFWTWRELMYRFVDRMTPQDLEAVASQAFMEMMERGFTRVGEFHYLHHDVDGRPYADLAEMAQAITAAAARTGIGLTLLPVYYAQGGFGAQATSVGQRRFLNDVPRFTRLFESSRRAVAGLPDAVVGVAPHSLRAAAPEALDAVAQLAGPAPIHIHIAEQIAEVDQCLAWSGQRPVAWLLDHQNVDQRWCLVHATHMTGAEIRALAASGAVAGLCPITEANLGDGLFPAVEYLAAAGRWGVGSDSNVRIDAAEELRLFEYGQRLLHRQRNVLAPEAGGSTGERLFREALDGAAQALGVAAGLAPGASADFFTLQENVPEFVARAVTSCLDSWIFAGSNAPIASVWRRGQPWVVEGRHREATTIGRDFRNALQRLLGS